MIKIMLSTFNVIVTFINGSHEICEAHAQLTLQDLIHVSILHWRQPHAVCTTACGLHLNTAEFI
jgi:hypothetical protein